MELLEKLANLNSSKAALMEEVVAAAEDRAQQGEEFNRSEGAEDCRRSLIKILESCVCEECG